MYARPYTLVANTVTTVTMDDDYDRIEVVSRDGAAEVWFTVDGATPTVDGNDQHLLPAAVGGLQVAAGSTNAAPRTSVVVKLISSGTPKVYVRGW